MLWQPRNWLRSPVAFRQGRRDGRVTMTPRSRRPANCCKRILALLRNRRATQPPGVESSAGPGYPVALSGYVPILTHGRLCRQQAEQEVGVGGPRRPPLSRPRATVATVFWPCDHSQRARRVAPNWQPAVPATYARQSAGCGGFRQEVGFAGCVLAPTVFLLRGSSRWSSQPGRARTV